MVEDASCLRGGRTAKARADCGQRPGRHAGTSPAAGDAGGHGLVLALPAPPGPLVVARSVARCSRALRQPCFAASFGGAVLHGASGRSLSGHYRIFASIPACDRACPRTAMCASRNRRSTRSPRRHDLMLRCASEARDVAALPWVEAVSVRKPPVDARDRPDRARARHLAKGCNFPDRPRGRRDRAVSAAISASAVRSAPARRNTPPRSSSWQPPIRTRLADQGVHPHWRAARPALENGITGPAP